jgi:hypothetical protein
MDIYATQGPASAVASASALAATSLVQSAVEEWIEFTITCSTNAVSCPRPNHSCITNLIIDMYTRIELRDKVCRLGKSPHRLLILKLSKGKEKLLQLTSGNLSIFTKCC